MSNTLTVSIIKDGHSIGNILYSTGRYNLLYAIQRSIDIINNYNKELLGAKLPEEILTLRMLQEENADGNKNFLRAITLEETDKYLRSKFNTYFLYERTHNTNERYGKIAVSWENIYKNLDDTKLHARIYIDELKVEFAQGITICNYKDAKRNFGVNTRELPSLESELSRTIVTACTNEVAFNALTDFYDFVNRNIVGWKLENDDYYYIKPEI